MITDLKFLLCSSYIQFSSAGVHAIQIPYIHKKRIHAFQRDLGKVKKVMGVKIGVSFIHNHIPLDLSFKWATRGFNYGGTLLLFIVGSTHIIIDYQFSP